MFNKCFGPTFSDTEFPPHEPQPNVKEGANLKLYKSPIAPCDEGVFINTLPVFIAAVNLSTLSFAFIGSVYNTEVCPYPPCSTSVTAFASASSKFLALYRARTGDNFSCANGSSSSTDSTSPIRTLAVFGTANPASSAIL